MHLTNRLSLESFYVICECHQNKFRVYLCMEDTTLLQKFSEIHRNEKLKRKLAIIFAAIKTNVSNSTQYNYEGPCENGKIYAIKIDSHRFYTIQITNNGYRELFISRYQKKESQKNTKKIDQTLEAIKKIEIQKMNL